MVPPLVRIIDIKSESIEPKETRSSLVSESDLPSLAIVKVINLSEGRMKVDVEVEIWGIEGNRVCMMVPSIRVQYDKNDLHEIH